MTFIAYAVLFGFAVAMTVRGILKRTDVSAFFVLAAYSLITLLMQMWWFEMGNRFGGAS